MSMTGEANLGAQIGGQAGVGLNPYASAAPGAQGPLGNVSVAHADLTIILAAGGALIVLGYIFRKGGD